MANQPAPPISAQATRLQPAYYTKTRLTLVGIFLAAFVLAGAAFWRTDFHTAWAGSSYPTIEIEGELFYVARSGDTLAELSEAFGVSEEELREANELAADAVLRVGQRVRVPASSDLYLEPADAEMLDESMDAEVDDAEADAQDDEGDSTAGHAEGSSAQQIPASPAEEFYIVQLGDSLQRIERITGVDAFDIAAYNNLTRPFPLYKGQRLRLTPPEGSMGEDMSPEETGESEPAPQQYTVRQGDTLQGIARQFGIEVDALVAANQLTGPYLYTGQILTIPAASVPPAMAEPDATETDATETDATETDATEADIEESDTEESADAEMSDEEMADEEMADEEMSESDATESDATESDATESDADAEETDAEETDTEDSDAEASESDTDASEDTGESDTGDETGDSGGDTGAKGGQTEEEMSEDEDMESDTESSDTESGIESDTDTESDADAEPEADAQSMGADMESGIALSPEQTLWQNLGESRIFVFSPTPGGAYHSQLEVIGLSQTFEGNVEMQLVDGDGEVLAERYATGGSVDGYDFFRTGLRFTVQEPTEATLTVFERSMEDGQGMLETVEIPVTLLPGQRFIDIHQPRPGEKLCGNVLLAGYSNTFEGNVTLEITDPAGEVQAMGFAIGGNLGIYREFFHGFDYSNEEPATLLITAYELDAAGIYDRVDSLTVPVSYFPADAPECE